MPWKDHSVQEERFRFIEEWKSGDWEMAELCRFYGISRPTGYKWVSRYEASGLEGLQDVSRAPHSHWNAIDERTDDLIVALRGQHPHWGATKIRRIIEVKHPEVVLPAESTIGAVLKRHGLTAAVRRRRRAPATANAPLGDIDQPNAVWCADFKGSFRTGDGTRIQPLTMTDAFSRFLFRCQGLLNADYAGSKPVQQAAFREYGLPGRIRTDNGAPFGSNGESGLTQMSVWWIRLGIMPERIRPGKPQENGRHERMHRTLKQETARPPAATRRAQQERFDQFRREYNEERPHEALDLKTPSEVYEPSPRIYPERLREVEYPAGWEVRRIQGAGQMRWKGDSVFVAHALENEAVGLEQIDDDRWRVWFSFYEIGTFDSGAGVIRRKDHRAGTPKPEQNPS